MGKQLKDVAGGWKRLEGEGWGVGGRKSRGKMQKELSKEGNKDKKEGKEETKRKRRENTDQQQAAHVVAE